MQSTRAVVAALALVGGALAPLHGQNAPQAQPMSLGRALNLALANSQTLDAAEYGLRVADQQVREAWGTLMPNISATASYQRNLKLQQIFLPAQFFDPDAPAGAVTPITVGQDNNWSAGLNVSQKLFEASAFIGVGAAGRYKGLQQEMVRGTAQQVVTGVREAYFGALLAQEELRLTEQSIARVRRSLEETRAMNQAGLASDYDVLRLEVQLANIGTRLERARNAVSAAKRQLMIEIGLDLNTPIVLEGRLNEIDLQTLETNDAANQELLRLAGAWDMVSESPDQIVSVAMRRRTDLRQLRSNVELEEARMSVERAEFFPKLSVFSNYNIAAQQDGRPNFFGTDQNRVSTAAAGLQVEIPIFNGFSRMARVEQAEATVRQREAQLERAELQTRHQVQTLLDSVHEARRRADAQRRAVAQARRGYEIASAEYREGIGSQLQLTDAEVALRETEFNYAQAVYDYLVARAQLELAAGLTPDEAGEFTDAAR
jgi:outer membrane protein